MADKYGASFPINFGSSSTQENPISPNIPQKFSTPPYFMPPPQYNTTPYFMQSTQNNVAPNFPYTPPYYATMGGQFMSQPSQVFSPPPSSESRKSSQGGSMSDKETIPPFNIGEDNATGLEHINLDENNATEGNNDCVGGFRGQVRVLWSKEEEIRLANSWSTISNCSKVGNAQKDKRFWEKTAAYFNENRPKGAPTREWNMLKAHYYKVIPDVNIFSQWYNNFYDNRASGQSDDDVLEATNAKWHSMHPRKDFKYMHVWRVMKEMQKWAPQQMGHCANKKSRTSDSGGNTSTNPDTDVESHRTRPMGQQRAKKLGKAKAKVSKNDVVDEKWEKMQQLFEQKIKQKDEEMKQKKLEMELQQIELEHKDFQLLCMDTSKMMDAQRECHSKIVQNIKVRRDII